MSGEVFNPFPGLRSFEAEEDHLFFGREHHTDELLERLRTTRFLPVVGGSGSGKSSLVRSGLIPSLHKGFMLAAGSSWRVAVARPGEDPIGNLAAVLGAPGVLAGEGEGLDEAHRALLDITLRSSARGLVDAVRQARIPPEDNILVVVDQFEELFRFKASRARHGARDEAVSFVKLLLEAAAQETVPVYVVLTLRSDFLGNCMELPGLPEAINRGLYLVPRMSRRQLRLAVTGPVAVGGGEIADRLVMRLLNEVGDDPDQLPVLQHTLMRLWDRWQEDGGGGPIDLDHYEAIGTLSEALSRHAEEAWAELGGEPRQRLAELLFKALTEKQADGRGVRRPARFAEVCEAAGGEPAEMRAVVECFRKPGRSFLMPPVGHELGPETILDISHESLMRVWTRLAGWVDEEAGSARFYRRLSRAAALREAGEAGLWREPELGLARQWKNETRPSAAWARRYDEGFERAMAFLAASQEGRRQEEAEQRKQRRTRWLAAVMTVAAVVILGVGVYAVVQTIEAEALRVRAEESAVEAEAQRELAEQSEETAVEQQRIAEAERATAQTQRELAELHEREALERKQQAEEQRLAAEAAQVEAERARDQETAQRKRAVEQQELARRAKLEAETSAAHARRLAAREAARALAVKTQRLRGEDQLETAALLALAAYRLHLANGGDAWASDFFNAMRATLNRLAPERATVLRSHTDTVRALALAPGGAILASAGDDRQVRFAALASSDAAVPAPRTFAGRARAVAWSADGSRLAAGAADGTLALRSGDGSWRALPPGASVNVLAWRPDGTLAVGRANGEVSLWKVAAEAEPGVSFQAGGRVVGLAFDPASGSLAAATGGGALEWADDRPGTAPSRPCDGDVRSVAFAPSGDLLACGTAGGDILLVERSPRAGPGTHRLVGHESSVGALAVSPTRPELASASSDGTVRLWRIDNPDAEPLVLPDHETWVLAVVFTPDGDRLISAGADRAIRGWTTRVELLAEEVCERVGRDLTSEEWASYLAGYEIEPTCPDG